MAKRKVRRVSVTGWLAEYGVYVLLIAVAAVTIILVVLAFNRSVPAGSSNGPQPSRSLNASEPAPAAPSAPTSSAVSPTTVAFLGDSYTSGAGATSDAARWTTLLTTANGWEEVNFGVESSGYVSGDVPYTVRVEEVVAARPDLIFVSGGRFDYSGNSTPGAVSTAITQTFTSLRTGLPSAKIVAINPTWGASKPPQRIDQIASEVRAAVEAVGGTYVDIGQPLAEAPGLFGSDGVLPNDAGYAKLYLSIGMTIAPLLAEVG